MLSLKQKSTIKPRGGGGGGNVVWGQNGPNFNFLCVRKAKRVADTKNDSICS